MASAWRAAASFFGAVTASGDKVVVKFAYNKEIHMAGPTYLLIKYEGQTK